MAPVGISRIGVGINVQRSRSKSQGGGSTPQPIVSVHPDDYSVKPTSSWSLRKVNPSFAGSPVQVSGNTVTTLVDIGFTTSARDALVSDSALATAMSGNTELRTRTVYDQYGSLPLKPLSAGGGPRVFRAAAASAAKRPAFKPVGNLQGLTTNITDGTGPFNIGGTGDKLSIIMAFTVLGYGGAAFATSPTVPSAGTNNNGTMLGFGSANTEFLAIAETENTISNDLTYGGLCVLNDDMKMLFERSTDFSGARRRVVGLKFDGTRVSGFLGSKKMFESDFTTTELDAVRMWVGSYNNGGNTANVEWYEQDVWNNLLIPDADFLNLMKNVGDAWDCYYDAVETIQASTVTEGQSNAGTTLNGSNEYRARLKQLLGSNSYHGQMPSTALNVTAFGGSAVQKAACATASPANYWLEQDLSVGPNMQTAKTAIAAHPRKHLPYVLQLAIGEQESVGFEYGASTFSGTVGDPLYHATTVQKYKDGIKRMIAETTASAGHAPVKSVVISLHKTTVNSYDIGWDMVRQAQIELSEEDPSIQFVSASLDLVLVDTVHWATDQVQTKLSPRLANITAMALKPSLNLNIRGPKITGYQFTDSSRTVIRATLQHAPNGGNDFTPTTGISGFYVADSGGAKTITSAVRVDATHIDITVPACVGATVAQYIKGGVYDAAKTIVDNATQPFPCEAGKPMTVAAAA